MPARPRRHLLGSAATTELNATGYGATGGSAVAKDPPLDCFYVYPTSRRRGLNSDMRPAAKSN